MKIISIIWTLFFIFSSHSQELKLGLPFGHTSYISSAEFSPDRKKVITASRDKTARLWDASSGKLILTLEGHTSILNSAVFSSDGKSIVTASWDNTARLWNVDSGELIHTLEGHSDYVWSASFSPDGNQVITASWDNTARIWDASTGKLLHTLEGHTASLNTASFSPNGKKIVTGSRDHTGKIWDATSGKLVATLVGHADYVSSAIFSSDSKRIITASGDHTARLWDTASGKQIQTIRGHTATVRSAVFSPTGETILTASEDKVARLWEASSGKLVYTFEGHTGYVTSALFSPNGKIIITKSGDKTARLWDASSGKLLHSLEGHSHFVSAAQFSPDGNKIVTASGDTTAKLWETNSGRLLHTLEGHITSIQSAVFKKNGKSILIGSSDSIARLWDLSSGKLLQLYKGHTASLNSAVFSPDEKSILTISEDKTARLWEASSGQLLRTMEGHAESINSARFSPDGRSIITTAGMTPRLWDASSGALLHTLKGHANLVFSAEFSPDGKSIITSSGDKTARLWNTASGKIIQSFIGHNAYVWSAEFSPDGNSILTVSGDYTARLWDTFSGKQLHILIGHTSFLNAAEFSPDGKKVLTVSDDRTARLWNTTSGALIHTFKGHTYHVNTASFSPDGQRIITASEDKTARLWDADSGILIKNLEGHTEAINSAQFSLDGETIITASGDGSVSLWNGINGKQLIQLFIFDGDSDKWIHLNSKGLFDASPRAMEVMYWTKDLEIIDFEQLKHYYYEPGLWRKVIDGKKLREVPNIKEVKLHPEVNIGEVKDGIVPVTFTRRDGGFGDITISINGIGISSETKGLKVDPNLDVQTVYYSVKDHPRLVNGANTITVSAASQGNIIQGRGSSVIAHFKENEHHPQFYGVIIGINEYSNPDINLNFPVKDANAIAKSIEMAANNLFTEGVHMYKITSETEIKPTKKSIQSVFEEISSHAKAEDVIFVHLSGHGVTVGDGLNNEFYFLTSDAISSSKDAYSLEFNREKQTISTSEWVGFLQSVNANKRIMIIDACGSGQAVDNLIAVRDMEGSQIKAIDRMKDRTGMFIISGSAADAVSYEASLYGQGLLSYSILQGIKGAALKESKYVDVETIFNYARETVPVLAQGIGGVQKPQLLIPKGGSFDIGIMNEEDKNAVPLNEPRRVFVRSVLVDKKKFRDVLDISKHLNEELSLISAKGEGVSIVFFDAEEYGNSCQITGGYSGTENNLMLEMMIICGEEEKPFTISGTSIDEVVQKIITIVNE